MINIETDYINRYFTVLNVIYGKKRINYPYPPFFGARSTCFDELRGYDELRPSNGLEISVLFYGIRRAINSGHSTLDREWEKLWENIYGKRDAENEYWEIPRAMVILPLRNLWIPEGKFEENHSLSGILVDSNIERAWNSEKMQIPILSDSENWRKNEKGIYISNDNDLKFIPNEKFRLGRHTKSSFIRDNYAQTIFTRRGAEIIASFAYDFGLSPYIRGLNAEDSIIGEESLDNPIQRDTILYLGEKELILDCQHLSTFHNYFLFGVFKEKKNIYQVKIKDVSRLKEL
ncbi:hypothetical protein HYW75_03270 [Candidatus Pacearchaeota archaeon]|nr:hypothetical protein [Candidatus Pacearchaeota archaeon]